MELAVFNDLYNGFEIIPLKLYNLAIVVIKQFFVHDEDTRVSFIKVPAMKLVRDCPHHH